MKLKIKIITKLLGDHFGRVAKMLCIVYLPPFLQGFLLASSKIISLCLRALIFILENVYECKKTLQLDLANCRARCL